MARPELAFPPQSKQAKQEELETEHQQYDKKKQHNLKTRLYILPVQHPKPVANKRIPLV